MIKRILALTLVLSLCLTMIPVTGHCSRIRWGGTDRTRQLGRQLPYDLIYTGANRGGVSTMVSGISHLASVNLAFGIILLDSTNRTFAIAAGETGQEITLVSTSGALKTLVLDLRSAVVGTAYAVNHTGWSSVAFGTAAGSSVTLTWLDDTRGWIITGTNNVTVTY